MNESKIEATNRLRREGRLGEASLYRDEVRKRLRSEGNSRQKASDEAWNAMLERFPPLPAPPTAPDALDLSDADDALIDRLAAVPIDIERDATWVYSRLEHPRIKLEDAPSLGAWGLLRAARADRQKFCTAMMARATRPPVATPVDDEPPDADPGLADLERMLEKARAIVA